MVEENQQVAIAGLANTEVSVAIKSDLVAIAKAEILNHVVLADRAVIPPGAEMEDVTALTTGEDVNAAAAVEQVLTARIGPQEVVAPAAMQVVTVRPAAEQLIAVAAAEDSGVIAAKEGVISRPVEELIGAGQAPNKIIAAPSFVVVVINAANGTLAGVRSDPNGHDFFPRCGVGRWWAVSSRSQ